MRIRFENIRYIVLMIHMTGYAVSHKMYIYYLEYVAARSINSVTVIYISEDLQWYVADCAASCLVLALSSVMFLHFSLCRQQFFAGFNFMYSSLVFILYLIKQIYFQVPSRLITQCYKHFSGIDSGYFQIFGLSVVLHYSMLFSYWIF